MQVNRARILLPHIILFVNIHRPYYFINSSIKGSSCILIHILGVHMRRVSFTHVRCIVVNDKRSMSRRHEQKHAFEKFADISEVLQPSLGIAWKLHYHCFDFTLSVLQSVDCGLLASDSNFYVSTPRCLVLCLIIIFYWYHALAMLC